MNLICDFVYQSVSDSNLLPNRYVHTSLSKKGIQLYIILTVQLYYLEFFFFIYL